MFLSEMDFEKLKEIICQDFGVTDQEIMSRSREQPIALARHFVWYYMRTVHRMTLNQIGSVFDRTHGAVLNAVQNLDAWRKQDREIQDTFRRIESNFPELKGGQA